MNPERRGYCDFCLLQGLVLFLGVQNFEFRYFVGCRGFVNYVYGYANLSRYFFPQVLFRGRFKTVDFYCVSFI